MKKITKDKKQYKPVLSGLIEEGLLALLEPKVSIKVREQDVAIAKEAIADAAKTLKKKLNSKSKLLLMIRIIYPKTLLVVL